MNRDPLQRYVATDRELAIPAATDARIQARMFGAYEESAGTVDPELSHADATPGVVELSPRPHEAPTSRQPAGRRPRWIVWAAVVLLVIGISWVLAQPNETDGISTEGPDGERIAAELVQYCTAIGEAVEGLPWRFDTELPVFPSVRAQLDELISLLSSAEAGLPLGGGVAAQDGAITSARERLDALSADLDALVLLADNAQWNEVARALPVELRELEAAIAELGDLGIPECRAVSRETEGDG